MSSEVLQILSYPSDNLRPRMLSRDGEAVQGILDFLEPAEGGLLLAKVGNIDLLIPTAMFRKLKKLQGYRVEIARIGQEYGCRRLGQ